MCEKVLEEYCLKRFDAEMKEMRMLIAATQRTLVQNLRKEGISDEIICRALMKVCGIANAPNIPYTEFLDGYFKLQQTN